MTALQIFHAAREGMTKVLCSVLNDLDPTKIRRFISQEVVNLEGERMTPLLVAVKQGHYKVVKLLVERFGADVNQCGAIRIDEDTLIEDASPLWLASGAGFINIVKDLVEGGAVVNHRTKTGSTPVRAACFEGRLDVVQYLTTCGADLEIPNAFDNTCLMIASYRDHYDTVAFLLGAGADPNKQALCGATALHFASEFGHCRVVELLLQAGATIKVNSSGFTPIMLAAEKAREHVVNLFLNRIDLQWTKQEAINAIELLGATFANDQKNYNLNLCQKYLRWGMEMRFEDPESPIPKSPRAPVPAYENRIECQSMADLNAIAEDENALHMESLMIRERLLNPNFTHETTIPMIYRGLMLADEGLHQRCVNLWLHRLHLLTSVNSCINKDIHRCTHMLSRIFARQQTLNLNDLMTVLSAARADLTHQRELLLRVTRSSDRIGIQEDIDDLILSIMDLLIIGTSECKQTDDEQRFHQSVYELIKLDVRTSTGKSLLHLAADPTTKANNILLSFGVKYPSAPVATLLIKVGANVNDYDSEKNTPLHLAVSPSRLARFMNTPKTIHVLLDNGAHVDAVNRRGIDPLHSASSLYIELIMRSHCKVNSLKCLAARAVCKYGQEGLCQNFSDLKDFVKLHSSEM